MSLFTADEYLEDLFSFDAEEYRRRGFSVILLDIDNTLSPHYAQRPDERVKGFLWKLSNAGFRVILLSNNTKERVATYAKNLPVEYWYFSLKPIGLSYEYLIRKKHLKKEEILCIGDQMLTDVLGGNLRGLHTICVKPLEDKDNLPGTISRALERVIRHVGKKM